MFPLYTVASMPKVTNGLYSKCPEEDSSGHLVYIIILQPLSPPACNPETKYFWQRMNMMSTGTRLATDMANT